MVPITVVYTCGHREQMARTAITAPKCKTCGATTVARVLNAMPTVRGECKSPLKVQA